MSQQQRPEILSSAQRIRALHKHLGFSAQQMAGELGCSAATLLDWEAGVEEPSPEVYIKLGNLAGDPSCWYFWSCAGLYSSDLMRVLPAVRLRVSKTGESDLEIAHAGGSERLFSRPQLHAIPLLPVRAATVGIEGDKTTDLRRVPAEGVIAAPSHWCPNPAFTICLRVVGSSMAPLICDGYIIVVDTSQTQPDKLAGEIVVAWEETHGLLVSRFVINHGRHSLVSTNLQYQPLLADEARPWRMVGKVLWWIGRDNRVAVLPV